MGVTRCHDVTHSQIVFSRSGGECHPVAQCHPEAVSPHVSMDVTQWRMSCAGSMSPGCSMSPADECHPVTQWMSPGVGFFTALPMVVVTRCHDVTWKRCHPLAQWMSPGGGCQSLARCHLAARCHLLMGVTRCHDVTHSPIVSSALLEVNVTRCHDVTWKRCHPMAQWMSPGGGCQSLARCHLAARCHLLMGVTRWLNGCHLESGSLQPFQWWLSPGVTMSLGRGVTPRLNGCHPMADVSRWLDVTRRRMSPGGGCQSLARCHLAARCHLLMGVTRCHDVTHSQLSSALPVVNVTRWHDVTRKRCHPMAQ
ncbi:uncharacterized protein LOC110391718 [Numida meleagris]|uniref:uncharacterized protein LOC110391718 n=1 Tax=Numida meleagris TaxID=8996 RepID=UPI000B3E33DA|nr:uncharacterized protein LOC110391718 [Numida meleagris]